jgi:hypothetical protein
MTCSPLNGSQAQKVILMGVHRSPWIMGLAAFTAAGITGCTQPARLAGPASRSHPARVIRPAAASGAPSSPSGPDSPGPAAGPVCPARQLKIRMIYGGPAAGTVGGVLGLTNQGREPCQLAGWPVLVARGPSGRTTAARTLGVFGGPALTRPPVVTIRPGAQAVAVLSVADAPGPGMTSCPPPYRRLRVTPPGRSHSSVVSAWIPHYGAYLPACYRVSISPVIPRSLLPYLPPFTRK